MLLFFKKVIDMLYLLLLGPPSAQKVKCKTTVWEAIEGIPLIFSGNLDKAQETIASFETCLSGAQNLSERVDE